LNVCFLPVEILSRGEPVENKPNHKKQNKNLPFLIWYLYRRICDNRNSEKKARVRAGLFICHQTSVAITRRKEKDADPSFAIPIQGARFTIHR